jgi:AcrR family transcriptional regulator
MVLDHETIRRVEFVQCQHKKRLVNIRNQKACRGFSIDAQSRTAFAEQPVSGSREVFFSKSRTNGRPPRQAGGEGWMGRFMNAGTLSQIRRADKLQISKYVTCYLHASLLNYAIQMLQRSSPDNTRSAILETAKAHLRRFGEDKMTIVDIARGLGMSHANIYRFFKNKAEILDAIIEEWLGKTEDVIEEIALRPGSAAERLETLVVELYRRKRKKLLEDSEVYESFRRVIQRRPKVVASYRKLRLETIVKIIREGVDSGEFELSGADAEEAGAIFEDAMTLFLNPSVLAANMGQGAMESRARKVVRGMVAGFTARAAVAVAELT